MQNPFLGWLDGLFRARRPGQRADRLALPPAPHLEAVAVHNSYARPWPGSETPDAALYAQSPWVYVAVSRIAEAAALVPLRVYRLDGEKRLAVENHPLERLLDRPNPHMSRFDLLEQTVGMLELTGNAYWFLAGDGRGRPVEIWPLRPDRVTVVPDPARYVRGYLYEIDGRHIPLEAVEVVHFKRWHPVDDYYGLPALQAAALAIHSDRAMARWNHDTFGQDNGVPAGIVNIPEFVSDADFERIKREWRSSYGSGQRRTAFLRGGSIQWQSIGMGHSELDFLRGRQAHRDEILNIFGVPVGLVSENATEANARVAERQFIERTLWPKLVRIAQKINRDLLPFYPGQHVAAFEDIRPTDVQARLDEIRAAQAVLSINEIRQTYYHLPPVDWGGLPVGMATPEPAEAPAPVRAQVTPADELAQWERFALKRHGQPDTRPFEVRALPDTVAQQIREGLSAAAGRDAVKAVFAAARAALSDAGSPAAHADAAQDSASVV